MKGIFKNLDIKVAGVIIIVIIVLALIPYCDRFSNMNCLVVSDEQTACQTIASKEENIVINFKCNGSDFPVLLNSFINNHKEFELKSVETKLGTDQEFIAIFTKNR